MISKKSDIVFRWVLSVAAASLLAAQPAQADGGASNLAADWRYPEPACSKPTPPVSLSQTGATGAQMSQYALTVEQYNKRSSAYTKCVNTYLDNANEDIRRIQQKMDAAVAAANAP